MSLAEQDPDVCGAALIGSAVRGTVDRWSDIDLAVQLAEGTDEATLVGLWTEQLDRQFGLADSVDVWAGGVRYRVFLLASTLQVDVSFWPLESFRSTGEPFQVLFGTPNQPELAAIPDAGQLIGMSWLYGLHVRSALGRGRLWQAVIMLDGLRDQVVALACLRHGLHPWQGREVDRLPGPLLDRFGAARAVGLTADELQGSLQRWLTLLLDEAEAHEPGRADLLRGVLPEVWNPDPNTDE